jgi:hypothetical protein
MTVSELIEDLQQYPPDTPVYIESGQFGYLISKDVRENSAYELNGIIPWSDAGFDSENGRPEFFVYISSPY